VKTFIYDIEVLLKEWLVIFKEVDIDKFYVFHNDSENIHDFIDDIREDIIIGFNNKHYDDYILKGIYHGADPSTVKSINDLIIKTGAQGWEHPFLQRKKKPFMSADLRDDVVDMGLSLKAIEGNLNLSIVESSISFDIDRKLNRAELEELIYYCKKDVSATELLYKKRIEYMNAKKMIGEMYGVDIREAMGMTNAKLCARIMNAEPRQFNDERDYKIPDQIDQGKIPEPIMKFFSQIWDKSIPDEELWKTSFDFVFETQAGSCPCRFAWGGAHGAKPCFIGESDEERDIENQDVASLYPNSILNFGYVSRTMEDPESYRRLVDTRLDYKHKGDKDKSAALKLPINTYYGAMLNKYNPLFDPKMGRSVCISNQLAMTVLVVSLAEECESFDLINFNTDGIMYFISKAEKEKCHRIVDEWSKKTGFEMELDPPIKKIIQKDVNNYIEIREDGHIKCKGGYVNIYEGSTFKMNSLRIVQKAVVEYFRDGTKVEKTVDKATDLNDFQIIAKTGSTYKKCVHVRNGKDEEVNKVNRVYASVDDGLGTLYKIKYVKGQERREKVANLPEHCIVDNDGTITLDRIDKSYYIKMAKSRISDFKNMKTSVRRQIEKMEVIKIMATTTKAKATTASKAATPETPKEDIKNMNVFQRLNKARSEFLAAPIKKSGKNKFAGFDYFTLQDIIPVAHPILVNNGLSFNMSFFADHATAVIRNVDDPEELIEYQTPITELDNKAKGMNSQQAIGAVETYARRRLWVMMLELVETDDVLDATSGKPEKKEERKGGKKNDEFLEGGDEPDDDFMNIPEGSPEYIEMLDPKTEKAIKKALRQYRDNDGDEDYIKECLLKMKKPYFSEQDGQAMLVEITEKL
jgi:hypothetical protein